MSRPDSAPSMPYPHFKEIPSDIFARASRVKLAVFDVDGVLTDGKLWYSDDGRELKAFHVQDGFGLKHLIANGIEVAIITGRTSHIVTERTAELGIAHVYQDQGDKLACFTQIVSALRLSHEQCCYTGDDVPDLPVMQAVGLSIAVANAHPTVLGTAHWRTKLSGGNGAAREVCDLLLLSQGKLDAAR
jgi:3-deoxy-D-manno-octulosonate 8-phosphate phosphatase (KDO 8-P phosphatase)